MVTRILDETIKAFDDWSPDCETCFFGCAYNESCKIYDALKCLREYKALLEKPRNERLMDILREVRGEK